MSNKIRVAELFAGVGGFRLGLEGWQGKTATSGYTKKFNSQFKVVWSNQWEPSTKKQHASEVYEQRWSNRNHSNEDISKVNVEKIPDFDMLVGGFPCQDYSVAKNAGQATGIIGKKGVLWWEIHRILEKKRPQYLFLENVDRLLKSPTKQRGRDFAIMLASLSDLGYAVEWRVINAAEYGMPQKRRRVFFMGFLNESLLHKKFQHDPIHWLERDGVFQTAFPAFSDTMFIPFKQELKGNLIEITENFNLGKTKSPFENGGVMINRVCWTQKLIPHYRGEYMKLEDIILTEEVPREFYLDNESLDKWKYLKGRKDELRRRPDGSTFSYKEGPLPFPDPLDRPARTIITSEGGSTPSRFKHIIYKDGEYRRLTPIELERINMFPDNHTQGASDGRRAFFMGNALVVGIIDKIARTLENMLK